MTDATTSDKGTVDKENNATIMLVSGELDKALLAFEISCALVAMGHECTMWFILYGINCLKKPRSYFSWRRLLPKKHKAGFGHNPKTDMFLQKILRLINRDGASHIPLSQLNLFGAGPLVLNTIMKRKGMAPLAQLITDAEELGVKFKICQICVDALACNVVEELVVKAEVHGVSNYVLESKNSHYNVVI